MIRFAFGAVVVVAVCAWPARADDAEVKKTVKGLVDKMQMAMLKGDAEGIIDLTHPKVVDEAGGREKAISATKTILKTMADKGFVIKSLRSGEPSDPVHVGKQVFILIPTTMEMATPKGKAGGSSFLLGVSTDGGKTWRFVDGAPGPKATREMFPELPKTFDLPNPEFKFIKD